MSRAALVSGLGLALLAGGARAQQPRRAVVVQVAGANLYLDVGSDSGVRAGDTLAVRRAPTAAAIGAASVIAATGTRSVITFVARPFPVTRGDTLYVTPGSSVVAAAPAVPELPGAAPREAPTITSPGVRLSGTLGLEMWGAHTTTVGLGADPVRSTQDMATPAVRFRTRIAGGGSTMFNLSLRAQHRTGPQGLFDPVTSVRIYEARFDHTAGLLRFSAGRFFSDFDHASGFWDGATVRVGREHGLSAGVAAGFEPARVNEGLSSDVPKYAAFVGVRAGNGPARLASDLAFHQTRPRIAAPKRTLLDWSVRVSASRFGLAQEVEAMPGIGGDPWSVSRYVLRASLPVGAVELYGSAVSDRPPAVDTAWALPLVRRERVVGGLSFRASRNRFYADLNGSINGPREPTRGYAAGATFALPDLIGNTTFAVSGSYYSLAGNRGVTANPSIEYRSGGSRMRAGYQFLLNDGPAYSATTHGGDVRFSHTITSRVDWVVQVTVRHGSNTRSSSGYSSLEVQF